MGSSTQSQPALSSFPADTQDQVYVKLSAIETGRFFLPDKEVFADSEDEDDKVGTVVPSFAFLVDHPTHGKLLFDLGLRKNGEGYPPALARELECFAVECPKDIAGILQEYGISTSDVSHVIYSHLHWDHVGDPNHFKHATFTLGFDAKKELTKAYPVDLNSYTQGFSEDQRIHFINFSEDPAHDAECEPAISVPNALRFISPFASFDQAFDFFGDGSFYVLDAPGHFPGHVAGCVRVGPNSFVILAGDCCHNRLCYDPGQRLISKWNHEEIDTARKTVDWLKKMHIESNTVVVLAHESERAKEMPLFPDSLNDWAMSHVKVESS